MNVRIVTVLGVDLFFGYSILLLEGFSVVNHSLDFFFRKSTLVIGNNYIVFNVGGLFNSGDLEDTIDINFEGNFNLRLTSGGRGDTSKIEFTE